MKTTKKKTSKKKPVSKVESGTLKPQISLLVEDPSEIISEVVSNPPKIVITVEKIYQKLKNNPQTSNIKIIHIDTLLLDEVYVDSKLEGELEVNLNSSEELSKFIDNPVIIKLETSSAQNDEKNNQINKVLPQSFSASFIGLANFDLLHLLDGTTNCIEETLVLYPPNVPLGIKMESWPNLPSIAVKAHVKDFLSHHKDFIKSLNILDVSVERIYNVSKDLKSLYDVTAYLRNPLNTNDIMKFTALQNKFAVSVPKYKAWATLDHVDGFGKMSKYEISNESNKTSKKFDSKSDKIEYFSFHRRCLDQNDIENLKEFIQRKPEWLIDITLTDKNFIESFISEENHAHENSIHLTAILDASQLLLPGECKIYISCPIDINENPLSEVWTNISESNNSSTSLKQLNDEMIDNQKEIDLLKEMMKNDMWIDVDISFCKPLNKKEKFADIFVGICNQISTTTHFDSIGKSSFNDEIIFKIYINNSARLLKESYSKFIKHSGHCDLDENDMNSFKKFMRSIGIYNEIVGIIGNAISVLVTNACTINKPKTGRDFQECLANVFIKLTQELNIAMGELTVYSQKIHCQSKNFLHYAYEAEILQDYVTAERYYLERIMNQKDVAQVWFDYAVFLKRVNNFEKANVIICKVLQLKGHHKNGLLVFGIFLMQSGKIVESEKYFIATKNLYPEFVEGWIALHLYYLHVESYKMADYALTIANEITNKSSCSGGNFMNDEEYFWLYPEIPTNRLFLRAASLFIKFGCFKFAEVAVAQDWIAYAPSSLYHYFCALIFYFQGNYINALEHLCQSDLEGISIYCVNFLKAYCYINLKLIKHAIKEFEVIKLQYNNSTFDTHLVDLQLGYYYFDIGDYDMAAEVYLNCCSSSPTPRAWLEAGKSLLRLGLYDDYEKCLIAAYKLDYNNVEVWICLALFFMRCNLKDEFKECFTMALKVLTVLKYIMQKNTMMEDYLPLFLCVFF